MYKVEYLPNASQEIVEIVQYIAEMLHSPAAADNILEKFDEGAKSLRDLPHRCPVVELIEPFKQQMNGEYRKLNVDNYVMLYNINESEKIVTITRVIYNRRNYKA